MQIQLLDGVTATNGAPSGDPNAAPPGDGFSIRGSASRAKPCTEAVLEVFSTAGSGTMTVTLKLF